MTSITKQLIIFLILTCCSTITVAQKQHFYGQIQDKVTHAGISDANISITGTKSGCTTDKDGEFSFYHDAFPVIIVVSHLGYETQQIRLDQPTSGLTILLKPVASMLQEVEIKAKNKPEIYYKDDQYSVLDYEVDSGLVYLLIYKFRLAKSQLLCKSMKGDTVACSGTLPFKPTGLFLDCLGCMHILSRDSAYQIYLKQDSLILSYVFDIKRFNSTLSDCVASTDEWLIFRKESFGCQVVDFYSINRKTSQKQYFASSRDETNISMLRKNPAEYYFLSLDTLPDGNENLIQYAWVKKILYKPNASVLHKIGDTICVFNTTNGNIDLYDSGGNFISGLTITFREKDEGDWTKEIYIDQFAHVPYTSFLKNGKLTFYQIDLYTGELKYTLTTEHIFPGKARIHDNALFYLYDLPGVGDNKHLFSQLTSN